MVFCNTGHVRLRCKHPKVTILILIDGFLQLRISNYTDRKNKVTILILIDGFLQSDTGVYYNMYITVVTILILIDGFLQ